MPTARTLDAPVGGPLTAPSALERCVGDAEAFLAQRFGQEPNYREGPSFDDLLSLADVDALLTGAGLRRPAVRLVRDGTPLPPASWTRTARTGSVTVDDLLDPGRVLELYAGGATIVLQSLHRWWAPLTQFCRDLEQAIGHAVQANAYLTPSASTGLAPHHDTHDVFVLQVHGAKHWTIRAPLIDQPLARQTSDRQRAGQQPVQFEVDLRPGACLYLPRGVIHSALAEEGSSLHLTIGVLATTYHDVVRQVVALAADVPSLRRPLPPGWATDPVIAQRAVKEALADLAEVVDGADGSEMARALSERYWAERPPPVHGLLLDLEALAHLDDLTRVELRPGVVWRAEPKGDRLELSVGARRIDLPAPVEPAVSRLLSGAVLSAAGLGDLLDQDSRLVLVRRLVREGLLRIVVDGA